MLTISGDRDEWEQQPDETACQYAAFRDWLDLGPARTTAELAEQSGRKVGQLRAWESGNQWRRRARLFDQFAAYRSELDRWEVGQRIGRQVSETAERFVRLAAERAETADAEELSSLPATASVLDKAARAVASTRAAVPPPVAPAFRHPLSEALRAGGQHAHGAVVQARNEVTVSALQAATVTAAGSGAVGSAGVAGTAFGLLAALAAEVVEGDHAGRLPELLHAIDVALAPYPEARGAVISAVQTRLDHSHAAELGS